MSEYRYLPILFADKTTGFRRENKNSVYLSLEDIGTAPKGSEFIIHSIKFHLVTEEMGENIKIVLDSLESDDDNIMRFIAYGLEMFQSTFKRK